VQRAGCVTVTIPFFVILCGNAHEEANFGAILEYT